MPLRLLGAMSSRHRPWASVSVVASEKPWWADSVSVGEPTIVDPGAGDGMPSLILDDPADGGARVEAQLLQLRQFHRMTLVGPDDGDGYEPGLAGDDPEGFDPGIRRIIDRRQPVLAGCDFPLLVLPIETAVVLDRYAHDRLIGRRGYGAKCHLTGRLLARVIRGLAGGIGGLLGAGEADAADQDQQHAADEERGHDEPPRRAASGRPAD